MLGEGYMYNRSIAQDYLIRVIEIWGFMSPPVALESLLASVILRIRKWHISSFVIQFGLVFHVMFIILLALALEYL